MDTISYTKEYLFPASCAKISFNNYLLSVLIVISLYLSASGIFLFVYYHTFYLSFFVIIVLVLHVTHHDVLLHSSLFSQGFDVALCGDFVLQM